MVRAPSLLLRFNLFVLCTPDHQSRSAFRNILCHVLRLNQDTPVRARAFHFRVTLKLHLLAPSCSSKGPLFQSRGYMFLFGITTIIFMLTTTDLILDFELTSQDISSTIHAFDRSFDNVWSPQKIRAVNVVNTVIPRLNARSHLPSSNPLLWTNETRSYPAHT
jgi:hypothetical protein